MVIGKQGILFLAAVMTLVVSACDTKDQKNAQDQTRYPESQGLIGVVKRGKLASFPATSIGNAFDSYSYLTKREWKTGQLPTGNLTVHFTGWIGSAQRDDKASPESGTGKALEVKFVFNQDGSFYLFSISAIDVTSDGKSDRTQLTDITGILAKIYGDKKIDL